MSEWRFLPAIDNRGWMHMAMDVALLEAVQNGLSAPILRFYRWRPACMTLGKFQPAEGNINIDRCREMGIDISRRPTGGRAIFHDDEVTFSVIITEKDLPDAGSNVMDSYRVLGAAMVSGMQKLGLPAELVDIHANSFSEAASVSATANPACFAARARCDLMVNGAKIIGSAQMRRDGVILQQNSLPLNINFPVWEEIFYRSDWEKVAAGKAVSLNEAAGRNVSEDEVINALKAGFAEEFGTVWIDSKITVEEMKRAEELADGLKVFSN
ncbi:MAG: lipoate--protein ligase family protein [bacterium]